MSHTVCNCIEKKLSDVEKFCINSSQSYVCGWSLSSRLNFLCWLMIKRPMTDAGPWITFQQKCHMNDTKPRMTFQKKRVNKVPLLKSNDSGPNMALSDVQYNIIFEKGGHQRWVYERNNFYISVLGFLYWYRQYNFGITIDLVVGIIYWLNWISF